MKTSFSAVKKSCGRPFAKQWNSSTPRAFPCTPPVPVGLIGDDVKSVARELSDELGVDILGFTCEGVQRRQPVRRPPYRQQHPVQSAGGYRSAPSPNPALFGEYPGRIQYRRGCLGSGARAFPLRDKRHVHFFPATPGSKDMKSAQFAELNLVMCHRSINYMADMMEKTLRNPLDQGEFYRPPAPWPNRSVRSPNTSMTRN